MSLRELTYTVPDMACDHCTAAVRAQLLNLPGVASVVVDLATKLVVVNGTNLDDTAVRNAIAASGYEPKGRGTNGDGG